MRLLATLLLAAASVPAFASGPLEAVFLPLPVAIVLAVVGSAGLWLWLRFAPASPFWRMLLFALAAIPVAASLPTFLGLLVLLWALLAALFYPAIGVLCLWAVFRYEPRSSLLTFWLWLLAAPIVAYPLSVSLLLIPWAMEVDEPSTSDPYDPWLLATMLAVTLFLWIYRGAIHPNLRDAGKRDCESAEA